MAYFFFTDLHELSSQTDSQNFGPEKNSETTDYRLTDLHSTTGNNPFAYAITKGQVLYQDDPNNNSLINAVLRPAGQTILNGLQIEYFVYKGILRNSVYSGTSLVTTDNDLTARITSNKINYNNKFDSANGNPSGTTTTPASINSLGVQYTSGASGDNERADGKDISTGFDDPKSDYQRETAMAGDKIGTFNTTNFGFEVVLKYRRTPYTFGEARSTTVSTTCTNLPSSPTNKQILENNSKRAKVLRFMDPSAFYGCLSNKKIKYYDSSGNEASLNNANDIYSSLLSVAFLNCNRVYVDIRNENGYHINYYDNYGSDIQIKLDSGSSLSNKSHSTYEWPILILSNADFTSANANNSSAKNLISLSLPKGDNSKPLVFLNRAPRFSKFPKVSKGKKLFQEVEYIGSGNWTDEVELAVPNKSGGTTLVMSYYIKLTYIKRRDSSATTSNSIVAPLGHYFNHFFSVNNLPTSWNNNKNTYWHSNITEQFIDAYEELGMSCWASSGIAFDDEVVTFYFQPKIFFEKASVFDQERDFLSSSSSEKSSFFDVIKDAIGTDKGWVKQELHISGSEVAYVSSNVGIASRLKGIGKNSLFTLTMLKSELGSVIETADVPTALSVDFHHLNLVLDQLNHTQDDVSNGYVEVPLKLAGLGEDGNYQTKDTGFKLYSDDGINYSSNVAAQIGNLPPGDIYWDNDNYNIVGGVFFRLGEYNSIAQWVLHDESGTVLNYEGTSEPIKLPLGSRVVVLARKSLPVANSNKVFIKIVCWHKGSIREGYISENAFSNATTPREYNPIEKKYPKQSLEAFIDDANRTVAHLDLYLNQIGFYKKINGEYVRVSRVEASPKQAEEYSKLLQELKKRLISDPDSLTADFNTALAAYDQGDDAGIKQLYKNLRSELYHIINGESLDKTKILVNDAMGKTPSGKHFNDDRPGHVQRIHDLDAFKRFLLKKIGVLIKGKPDGQLTFQLNGKTKSVDAGQSVEKLRDALKSFLNISEDNFYQSNVFDYTESKDQTQMSNHNYPVYFEVIFYKESNIDPASFTVTSQFSGGNSPSVKVLTKDITYPIPWQWFNKHEIDLGFFARRIQSAETFDYTNIQEDDNMMEGFKLASESLYTTISGSPGNPDALNSPEGNWLANNSELEKARAITYLSKDIWPGYTDSVSNPFLSFNDSEIPIDQSFGFINSNAAMTLIIHEAKESVASTAFPKDENSTHLNIDMHNQQVLWQKVNELGFEEAMKAAKEMEEFKNTFRSRTESYFFRRLSVFEGVILKHYLDRLGY